MPTYAEFQEQITVLSRQAEEARQREIAVAVAEIREKVRQYGLNMNDIFPGTLKRRTRKVPPKYRNPETGETWSGRGNAPRWLVAAVEQGKTQESFRIHYD